MNRKTQIWCHSKDNTRTILNATRYKKVENIFTFVSTNTENLSRSVYFCGTQESPLVTIKNNSKLVRYGVLVKKLTKTENKNGLNNKKSYSTQNLCKTTLTREKLLDVSNPSYKL